MTNRNRVSVVLAALISTGALAQEATASVMPFTLDVQRVAPGFSKKEIEELRVELPRLLRVAKLSVPSTAVSTEALIALKRQDCDRDDGCLQQLAQKAETLYAIYASIDYTIEKNVVAAGRVVGDDGSLVRRQISVTLPKGKAAFGAVAREALAKLVGELELTKLPTSRAVVVAPTPVVVVKPEPAPPVVIDAPVAVKPVVEAPPPQPPMVQASNDSTRTIAYVTIGAGLAAVIFGAAYGLTAEPIRFDDTNVVADDAGKVAGTRLRQGIGLAAVGVGAAAIIVGAVIWGTSPASGPSVAVMPIAGGGVVSVGGTFQ